MLLVLVALVLMASLPASPGGSIFFPVTVGVTQRSTRTEEEIDKEEQVVHITSREMLAYQNLIKCWLGTFLKMLLNAPRITVMVGRWRGA